MILRSVLIKCQAMVVKDTTALLNVDLSCSWMSLSKSSCLAKKSRTESSGLSNPLLSKSTNDASGVLSGNLRSTLLSAPRSSLSFGVGKSKLLNSTIGSNSKTLSGGLSLTSPSSGSLTNKALKNVTCFADDKKTDVLQPKYMSGGSLANPSLSSGSVGKRSPLLSKRKHPSHLLSSRNDSNLYLCQTPNRLLQSSILQSPNEAKQAKRSTTSDVKQTIQGGDASNDEEKVRVSIKVNRFILLNTGSHIFQLFSTLAS